MLSLASRGPGRLIEVTRRHSVAGRASRTVHGIHDIIPARALVLAGTCYLWGAAGAPPSPAARPACRPQGGFQASRSQLRTFVLQGLYPDPPPDPPLPFEERCRCAARDQRHEAIPRRRRQLSTIYSTLE